MVADNVQTVSGEVIFNLSILVGTVLSYDLINSIILGIYSLTFCLFLLQKWRKR